MKRKIVMLAVGDKYKTLSKNLVDSLRNNNFNGEIIIFNDTNEIENISQSKFCFMKKLFQLSKCNENDTKYLFLDVDMIALDNPNFIFEEIKDNEILCNVLKADINSKQFKNFYDSAKILNIKNIDNSHIRCTLIGFTGKTSYIFNEAVNLYKTYKFLDYGHPDSVNLTLACMLKNVKMTDIDMLFGKTVVSDSFSETKEKCIFKHFTRFGI